MLEEDQQSRLFFNFHYFEKTIFIYKKNFRIVSWSCGLFVDKHQIATMWFCYFVDRCIATNPNHSKMAATSLVRTMRRNSFEELVFQIRPTCKQNINSKPFDPTEKRIFGSFEGEKLCWSYILTSLISARNAHISTRMYQRQRENIPRSKKQTSDHTKSDKILYI